MEDTSENKSSGGLPRHITVGLLDYVRAENGHYDRIGFLYSNVYF